LNIVVEDISMGAAVINNETVESSINIGYGSELTTFNVTIGVNSNYADCAGINIEIVESNGTTKEVITKITEMGYIINGVKHKVTNNDITFDISKYESAKLTVGTFTASGTHIKYDTNDWDSNCLFYGKEIANLYYILNEDLFGDGFCELVINLNYN